VIPILSEAQKTQFAEDGYLVIPDFLERSQIDVAIDYCWSRFPVHFIRNKPSTWRGEVEDSCHRLSLSGRGGLVKFQKNEIRPHVPIDQLLPTAKVQRIVQQLIGPEAQLDNPLVRGLYPTLPISRFVAVPLRGHIEAHAMEIGTISYLNDVKKGAGAFSLWPGSHIAFYKQFRSKLAFIAAPGYNRLVQEFNQRDPIQIEGKRGDTIFFHHRLFHAPSNNLSRSIRFAYLCDYRTTKYPEHTGAAPQNMWDDWPEIERLCPTLPSDEKILASLTSSKIRRIWVSSPKLRKLFFNIVLNEAAKKRAGMSREVRSQKNLGKRRLNRLIVDFDY